MILQAHNEEFSRLGVQSMKKGTLKLFNKIKPSNTYFQLHKWRKYHGRITDIVALKVNDSFAVSYHGRKR